MTYLLSWDWKSYIPSLPILFDILCHSNLSLPKFGVDDSHLRSQRIVVAGWGNTDVITTENMLKAYTTPRLFWHITCKIIWKNITWIFTIETIWFYIIEWFFIFAVNLNDINVAFKLLAKKISFWSWAKWWQFDKNVIKHRNLIVFLL